MSSANRSQYGSSHEGKERSPLAFRFRKEQQKTNQKPSPFTEMPEGLKENRFSFGRLVRGLLNSLVLVILIAVLVALIAAFAYQMMNDPEMLAEASYNLVTNMENFIRSLLGSG